jgi:acyl carrier protein
MNIEDKQKRIEGLEAIKNRALTMAREGVDSFGVRDFITEAKTELAYELPDEEAFRKAVAATQRYQKKKR